MRCFCFALGYSQSAMPSSKDYLKPSDVLTWTVLVSQQPFLQTPWFGSCSYFPLYWHGNSTDKAPHAAGLHGRRCGSSSNVFCLLQPALCKQISGFSWTGQGGSMHYQERKGWYSPGNSEWAWSVVNIVLIKPNRSIALSRTAELWLSQDAQGWISLDCTLDFTWHEAHIWSPLQKNGFCPKRLHAWIYLNCHLQEDIH